MTMWKVTVTHEEEKIKEAKNHYRLLPVTFQDDIMGSLSRFDIERLLKTAAKVTPKRNREENQILMSWALRRFDLSECEFKDIVETWLDAHSGTPSRVLRSWKNFHNPDNEFEGRTIDVLCSHCACIHSHNVRVGVRKPVDLFILNAPCSGKYRPINGLYYVNDDKPIAKWETDFLDKNKNKNGDK